MSPPLYRCDENSYMRRDRLLIVTSLLGGHKLDGRAAEPTRHFADWPWWAALGGLTLLAFALRRYHLGQQSLWLDEIGQAVVARSPDLPSLLAGVRGHAGAAPLDYLGVGLITSVLGEGTVAARMWAAVVGSLTVLATGVAARGMFHSRATGLLAGALVATAPYLIAYSQEARFYALFAAMSVAVLGAFHAATASHGMRLWLVFGLVCGLALLSHYFTTIVIASCGLALLVRAGVALLRASRRTSNALRLAIGPLGAYALALAVAAAISLPWSLYATVGQAFEHPYGDLPPIDVNWAASLAASLFAPAEFQATGVWWRVPLTIAPLALALIGFTASIRTGRPAVLAVGVALASAVPATRAIDERFSYAFIDRQVIFLIPYVLILAAAGAVVGSRLLLSVTRIPRWLAVMGGAAIVAAWLWMSALPLSSVYAGRWPLKENWRAAADLVADGICSHSTVLVNIAANYRHGIGFYRPELIPHIDFVRPGDGIDEEVRDRALGPSDWVVVFRNVPSGGEERVIRLADWLGERNFSSASFAPWLRVFVPPRTCTP